jgi:hypothetical protein
MCRPIHAGRYAVGMTNAHGSAISSNATLNVYSVPVITSFSPQSGRVGTVVNISGLNFDPVPGNNTVHFGAVQAIGECGERDESGGERAGGGDLRTDHRDGERVGRLCSTAPFLPTFLSALAC